MTTPERLRARQRRESAFIAILAIALAVVVFIYRYQEERDDRCFRAYLANQSETSKTRGEIVERESQATRDAIHGSGSVTSREEFKALLEAYDKELRAVDQARKDNPIQEFNPETC